MAHLSNGTQIFIEGSKSAEVAVTAISNAVRPVMTVADTTDFVAGDFIVVVSSSWSRLTSRQLRVVSKTATTITVEGIDTTNILQFPAGATASIYRVLSWFEMPCIQDVSTDGGEQQFVTYQCLSDDREQQIPTYKSAVNTTYTFAHEYSNPIYPVLREYDESSQALAIRAFVPKASEIRLWTGTVAFNETPNVSVNEIETVSVAITVRGRYTFLPSVMVP
ncbi:MAG: phage tail protein [Bacteroidales bacterium]|nr:phage tail protein [Bacteroidales bacterium]MCF0221392.1 phage tail protein [Fibrobacter sp.]